MQYEICLLGEKGGNLYCNFICCMLFAPCCSNNSSLEMEIEIKQSRKKHLTSWPGATEMNLKTDDTYVNMYNGTVVTVIGGKHKNKKRTQHIATTINSCVHSSALF